MCCILSHLWCYIVHYGPVTQGPQRQHQIKSNCNNVNSMETPDPYVLVRNLITRRDALYLRLSFGPTTIIQGCLPIVTAFARIKSWTIRPKPWQSRLDLSLVEPFRIWPISNPSTLAYLHRWHKPSRPKLRQLQSRPVGVRTLPYRTMDLAVVKDQ